MLNVNALGLPFKPLVCNHPAPVTDGCILYLDGRYGSNDPATQTWYDLSGMGNDGTLNNFAYAGGSGWTGKGLGFDGVDDYVDCGRAVVPTGDFTITALCDVKSFASGFRIILGQYLAGDVGRFWFGFDNNTFGYRIGDNSQTVPAQLGLQYLSMTKQGAEVKLYVNGELKNISTVASEALQANTFVGAYDATNGYFDGIIHNVFVYNRALSPREITQNYLAGRCIMPLRHIDNATTPAEILQNELAAKFCPLFHDHYNTAGVEWEVAQSTKMTRLGTTANKTAGSDFDSIYPYSEMKLCNVNDNGEITAYIGDDGFKRDGTNGQVMVKIPKFYYRHVYGEAAKKHQFWISEHPISGFKLHPAFIRAGVEKPYVLLGAYKASFGRNQVDTADTLASVSGVLPAVSRNINQFRTLAEARGQGWTLADALTRNAVALLYLVEYADTDSQSAIGAGVTDPTNTAAIVSGGCDYLVGASGNAVGETGKVSVSYRGLEDLWGNVWEFVDGININDRRPYVADHGFASDVFDEPYTDAGFDLPGTNNWVNNFACSAGADWLLMPSAVGANSGYIPDYYYQATGNRVARVGGHWRAGGNAGLFSWAVYTSSAASLDVGARLLQIP